MFCAACFFMMAALALYLVQFSAQAAPVGQWAGKKAVIKARMLDYPQRRYHRYYYRLRVEEVDKTAVEPFTLRLSAAVPLYGEPYDWVECPVGFYAFDTEGGAYSQRNAQLAGGYQIGGYLAGGGGVRTACGDMTMGKALALLRRGLARRFSRLLPEEDAGLLQAMLLADRDNLLEEAYGDFRLIGCAHLLAVSGLHMGAVQRLLSSLLGRVGMRRRPRALVCGLALAGYLCVTGFPVSAVRAFAMCGVYLLGSWSGRRADSLNSLGFALLLICLGDPFSGGDLSLALSAFATLGILTLSPKITGALLRPVEAWPRVRRLCMPIAAGLGVTLSAMAATAPWQVFAFRGVSLLAPVANLLLVLPCTLLLYCALLALVFSVMPGLGGLAEPFAFCAGWLGRLSRQAAGWLADVPRAYVYLGAGETVVLVGVLLIGLLLCAQGKRRLRGRVLAGMLGVCLLVFVPVQGVRAQGEVALAVWGSGEEACVVLVRGQDAAVLRAGAREGSCTELLRRYRVGRVRAFFLPWDGAGERRCGAQVLGDYPVGRVVLPEGAYVGREFDPEETGVPVAFVGAGGAFEVLPGIWAGYGEEGDGLAFMVNGVGFWLPLEKEGPLVRVEGGGENSPFTVLPADAIIEVTPGGPGWKELAAGQYARFEPGRGLELVVGPDGKVTVREGS